jgi:predicted DNA-binding WGR domain protein
MKNYFEYKDDKSAKFWEINLEDLSVTTTYGKIGTTGQVSEKTFESNSKS